MEVDRIRGKVSGSQPLVLTMPRLRFALPSAILLLLVGCRAEPVDSTPESSSDGSDGSAEWEELGDGTDGTKDDDGGSSDTGKDGYRSCGDEVVEGATCEGSWEDTLCVDDAGTFWWCEGGVWTADKGR